MEIQQIVKMLEEKKIFHRVVSIEKISVGMSGASLYQVTDECNTYVVKNAQKSFCDNEGVMDSCRKEIHFYQIANEKKLSFIPNILFSEEKQEYGTLLVMQYLTPMKQEMWNEELLKKAVRLGAYINSRPINDYASLGIQFKKNIVDEIASMEALIQWKKIIMEHPGRFDESKLETIYENLKLFCNILNQEPHYLCHGDFHSENLLTDGNDLYVCDWQCVNVGKGIGDFSFFISRGKGFGIEIPEEILMEEYCKELSKDLDREISPITLKMENDASTIMTTFMFWAYYLENSTYENVKIHFDEMLDAYQNILKEYH